MSLTEAVPAPGSSVPVEAVVAGPEPEEISARLWKPIPGSALVGWLAPLAVTLFGFALRLWRLSTPIKVAFDEVYYSCDAHHLAIFGYEHTNIADKCIATSKASDPRFIVHPPLGKWLIALGEHFWRYNPHGGKTAAFGWRIAACVFGTLSIFVVCRLGRRLFRSTWLGCLAGGLLALDGLHFVQSRMAMLDIFLMFFVVATAACFVVDREWARRRLAARLPGELSKRGPKLGFRPWRLAAGVMLGCAVATKWSALYYIAAMILLAFAWDVGARRLAGIAMPMRTAFRREFVGVVLLLLLVPAVVYVASWTGWFVNHGGWRRDCGTQFPTGCGAVSGFIKYHQEIWNFHVHLHSPHTYASKPFGWLLLARPVSYWYETPIKGTSQEVLGIGTPAIWWASIIALIGCAWGWISRRDWRASFILVGFAAGYLPWFWPADRTEFLFYALPAVPFMCLALAYCAGLALGPPGAPAVRRKVAALSTGVYCLLVVVNFFYLYPILAAKTIPYASWHARMWFTSWI